MHVYTEDAGLAVNAAIPVKLQTAHGRSQPKVGSTKRIDVSGNGGVSWNSLIIGTSDQKNIPPAIFWRPKQNFYSLTICS